MAASNDSFEDNAWTAVTTTARPRSRLLKVVSGVLVLAVATPGCQGSDPQPKKVESDSRDVVITGLPAGRSVAVTKTGSSNGLARLAALGVRAVSQLYDLSPSGELEAEATIRIPLSDELPPDSEVVAATRTSEGERFNFLPAKVDASGRYASFKTDHFSEFGIFLLDVQALLDAFKKQFIDGVSSGLTVEASPPHCAAEDAARHDGYSIRSSKGGTLHWCFGLERGVRVLKITNRLSFPLQVDHPNMGIIKVESGGIALSSLSSLYPGHDLIVAPAETATLNPDLEPRDAESVETEVDSIGQTLYDFKPGSKPSPQY